MSANEIWRKKYEHFCLFALAMRLMLMKKTKTNATIYAGKLLEEFVSDFGILYWEDHCNICAGTSPYNVLFSM